MLEDIHRPEDALKYVKALDFKAVSCYVHSYYVVQLYMYITETMLMNDHIVRIYTRTFSSHIFVYKMYFNALCHLNHLFCSQSIYLHVHCIITKSA